VLLVTTRGTGQWMIPKGWPMPGRSHAEAAAQEAYEEAGLRGRIRAAEAGRFRHLKTRPGRPPLRCTVAVHLLEVEEELGEWPEQGQRERRWFPAGQAAAVVRSPDLAAMIRAAGG
jgi:8-oxo-dGTP pyrophosphatase MutT (NUDIX family)